MVELLMSGKFSIIKDNELIKAGTHFWCQACVIARPLSEQSSNPHYCKSCYQVIKTEKQFSKSQPKNVPDMPLFHAYNAQEGGLKPKQAKLVKRKQ